MVEAAELHAWIAAAHRDATQRNAAIIERDAVVKQLRDLEAQTERSARTRPSQ